MTQRVLIVEDERGLADAMAYALQQESFHTEVTRDGARAIDAFRAYRPDLVLLDLMLPGVSGWEVFSSLRQQRPVPIIVVSARAEETDRVTGLEKGADDYVTKPFSMRELVARVRAVLRRSRRAGDVSSRSVLWGGGVSLDTERHEVLVDDRQVQLSPKEFSLLAYLMRHAGRTRSRDQILAAVWGGEEYRDQHTVDVHIRWLRRKVEEEPGRPRRVLTVRGVGYKFADGM
jgi:two-component system response regulator RegX3